MGLRDVVLILPSLGLLLLLDVPRVQTGPRPSVYDQRQDGKYNVRIHLKDFRLFSLGTIKTGGLNLGDYDESNYDYEDPPEPSEKPETTPKSPAAQNTTQISTLVKVDIPALASNATTPTNATLTHSALTHSNLMAAAVAAAVDATPTQSSPPTNASADCIENNATTPLPAVTPTNGRPARIQPIHVTRNKVTVTSTTQSTPYQPYSIISTTKRPTVKVGVMRKMRCRPGWYRDRSGRCRKIGEPIKTSNSPQLLRSPIQTTLNLKQMSTLRPQIVSQQPNNNSKEKQ